MKNSELADEKGKDEDKKSMRQKMETTYVTFVKTYFAWIKPHLNKRDVKIAFRVAVAAWVGMLLLLIDTTRNYMGYAAYLTIILVRELFPRTMSTKFICARLGFPKPAA